MVIELDLEKEILLDSKMVKLMDSVMVIEKVTKKDVV